MVRGGAGAPSHHDGMALALLAPTSSPRKRLRRLSLEAPARSDGLEGWAATQCNQTSAFPRHDLPELLIVVSLEKREGAGNAGRVRTGGLVCSEKSTRVSHHRYAERHGIVAQAPQEY